jgi:5-methylcytosine-specific restriction enzyme subunit McrC
VEGLVIEILPKAESNRDECDAESAALKWQRILVSLLREAGYMDVRAVDEACLRLQDTTLLDLLFSQYLDSVEQLLREGLVKRYRSVTRDRGAVKGRIDHAANIRKNFAHAERIRTAACEYDRIHLLNQILKAATDSSALFAPTGYSRNRARNIGLSFADWPSRMICPGDFKSVHLDRKTATYKRAIGLARLIIGKQNPDLAQGTEQVFSLLFDMNDLWEAAILARVRKEASRIVGYKISSQRMKVFWRSDNGSVKTIRPDIVIEMEGKKCLILDTKWKILPNPIPGDQDLKQIFAYDTMWDSDDGFLVYPKVSFDAVHGGRYEKEINGSRRGCTVVFTEVDPERWGQESLLEMIGCVDYDRI